MSFSCPHTRTAFKTFLMGIMAGCYISFGGFMAVTAATMCAGKGVARGSAARCSPGCGQPHHMDTECTLNQQSLMSLALPTTAPAGLGDWAYVDPS